MARKGQAINFVKQKSRSNGLLGRTVPDSTRKKISLSLTGHSVSKETKNKISRSVRAGITEEYRNKQREKAIALGWPAKARRKSERFNKNFVFTDTMKKKISDAHRREKHYNWKGGISTLAEIIRFSLENKVWRQKIFQRDDYTCQKCGRKSNHLVPHHKKAFSLLLSKFLKIYSQFSPIEDKETLARLAINYKPFWKTDNGITFCEECHSDFHKIYGRRGDNTINQLNEFLNYRFDVGVILLKGAVAPTQILGERSNL